MTSQKVSLPATLQNRTYILHRTSSTLVSLEKDVVEEMAWGDADADAESCVVVKLKLLAN